MEHRFDTLAKAVAGGVSRRAALGRLAGGLTGALLGSLGLRSARAQQAQSPPQGVLCVRSFELAVRVGPSAGLQMQGALALNVGDTGSIDQGALVLADGTAIPVTGQADGRAINLLFDMGHGRLLYGVGSRATDIRACTGAMGGPFVGPQAGDLGDWAALETPPQNEGCVRGCEIATDCRPGTGGYGLCHRQCEHLCRPGQ